MRHEGHLNYFSRHPLTSDIDFDLHTWLGAVLRQICGSDRGIDRGGYRPAADEVHLHAIQKHRIAVARDGFWLGHLEPHEPAPHPFEPLALQSFEAGERRAFLELHDEAQPP